MKNKKIAIVLATLVVAMLSANGASAKANWWPFGEQKQAGRKEIKTVDASLSVSPPAPSKTPLTAEQKQARKDAAKQAEQTFKKDMRAARDAYEAALKSAREAFQTAMKAATDNTAKKSARDVYQTARKAAIKAYNDAKVAAKTKFDAAKQIVKDMD